MASSRDGAEVFSVFYYKEKFVFCHGKQYDNMNGMRNAGDI